MAAPAANGQLTDAIRQDDFVGRRHQTATKRYFALQERDFPGETAAGLG
jgi:hypothetical protein